LAASTPSSREKPQRETAREFRRDLATPVIGFCVGGRPRGKRGDQASAKPEREGGLKAVFIVGSLAMRRGVLRGSCAPQKGVARMWRFRQPPALMSLERQWKFRSERLLPKTMPSPPVLGPLLWRTDWSIFGKLISSSPDVVKFVKSGRQRFERPGFVLSRDLALQASIRVEVCRSGEISRSFGLQNRDESFLCCGPGQIASDANSGGDCCQAWGRVGIIGRTHSA